MIRRMAAADLDAVAGIWLSANLDAHSFIPAGYWEGNYEKVKAAIAEAECYVYEDAGGVEGFVGLSGDRVEGLFVAAPARSRGIGARLLGLAKALRPRLELNVYAQNARAVAFYEREGFTIASKGVDDATGQADCLMVWSEA